MAFIDWGGPFRQIRTHRRPISQFLMMLALLVAGDVALRFFVVQWVLFGSNFTWKALLGAILMLLGVGLVIRGGHSV